MRGLLGILIWVAAAAGAGVLWYTDQPAQRPLPGLVGPPSTHLASTEALRLIQVDATPGQVLKAGAIVARFDTRDIDAELAVAHAEKRAAEAEIAAQERLRGEALRDKRARLLAVQAEARAAQGEAKSRRAAATAEMRTLGRNVERIREIAAQGLARGDGLASIEGRRARLRQEARATAAVLTPWAELQSQVEQALASMQGGDDDQVVASARARAAVWAARIQALEMRRSQRALSMPYDGRVLQVLRRPGATVPAGEAVVELAPSDTRLVRVWAPEQGARRWTIGKPVLVRASDRKAAPVAGVIKAMSPGMVALPQRMWQHPNLARYGRLIEVTLDQPGFLAGESVVVRPK